MPLFNNTPIKKKITGIVLITSCVVLALASGVFVGTQILTSRGMIVQELATMGSIIASNSTAAVVFEDRNAAQEILSALRNKPNIVAASIYRNDGSLFVQYQPQNGDAATGALAAEDWRASSLRGDAHGKTEAHWLSGYIDLYAPILLEGTKVGAVYIRSNLSDMYSVIVTYLVVVAGVIILGIWIALVLSSRLQKIISRPILDLLNTMKTVSDNQDYSIRAHKHDDDELGGLAEGFNAMLETIENTGLYEPLSGLPNLPALQRDLAAAIARQEDGRATSISVLSLSVHPLSDIDVTLGYTNGDRLVREVAQRLLDVFGDRSRIYHVARDRFALILPDVGYEETVAAAETGLQQLRAPVLIEGIPVRLGGHAGIAQYPTHGKDAQTLVRITGLAVSLAEQTGRDYAIYDQLQDQAQRNSLLALMALREALLVGDQLTFHYQPKIEISTGRCIGVEALIRWTDQEGIVRPPDTFIPLAERTGLIVEVSQWAMKTALQQLVAWQNADIDLCLAVNLSARDLADPTLLDRLGDLLRFHAIEPHRLEVEVTESAVMENPGEAQLVLEKLRDVGVGVAIDDFGVGQSSLTYLKNLPANSLKLDRSFLHNLESEPRQEKLVRAAIDMAHDLDLTVVAEGVETEATYERLINYGCDFAQGYYLCRPLPEPELRQWLKGTAHGMRQPAAARVSAESRRDNLVVYDTVAT